MELTKEEIAEAQEAVEKTLNAIRSTTEEIKRLYKHRCDLVNGFLDVLGSWDQEANGMLNTGNPENTTLVFEALPEEQERAERLLNEKTTFSREENNDDSFGGRYSEIPTTRRTDSL